ncbi:MAG TPA: dihydroorotate dehydrogenase electron transfer subunit [Candidatus Bathyarchaeia archaeon]|nr:dihydroorotate dehydrogenase electron transfer subunit [Candidatus Bathyarchaeia archaeon]
MYVRNVEIIDVKIESKDVKTFFFDHAFDFVPGQYVMIWIRGIDEIPMSLSYANGVTVREVGSATAAMCALRVGDTLGVRGPFGNGFSVTKPPALLVAGGVGAAPLAPLAEALRNNVMTLLGAKTKDELLFTERFKSAGPLWITTDNGSAGYKGATVDVLDKIQGYHEIVSCGPEKMMRKVLDYATAVGASSQFSLHRFIKCGVGLCGSCCIDPSGLRVCSDGPVFKGVQLQDADFGTHKRDAAGRRVNL